MEQKQSYFKSSSRYPYGLTEEQVCEAFIIFEKKVKQEILIELQSEYPLISNLLEEDDSILEVILRTIDLSINKGMEISVNHMEVLDYYRERQKEQDKPSYNVTEYEFQKDRGISGILLPNGEFLKCGNAEHYMLVEDIEFDVQKKCIYFSSVFNSQDGVVTFSPFSDKTITIEQRNWIESNIHYLDDNQREMYNIYFEN